MNRQRSNSAPLMVAGRCERDISVLPSVVVKLTPEIETRIRVHVLEHKNNKRVRERPCNPTHWFISGRFIGLDFVVTGKEVFVRPI